MRILQLIESPQRRGAEVFAAQLSSEFRRLGNEVVLVALKSHQNGHNIDVDEVLEHRRAGSKFTSCSLGIARLAAAADVDIVQANGGSTLKHGAMAALVSGTRRWRFVYRNIGDPRVWLSSPLRRFFYRAVVWPRIDGVVSVSEHAKEGLRAIYGVGGPPIEVIYQGVDERGLKMNHVRSNVRATLETPGGSTVLGWIGAMTGEKRPDRALRVLRHVNSPGQPAVLWMVGGGVLRSEMERVAEGLGVADSVRWVGSVEDVGSYLNAVDVFLLTSDTEGIPGALLEAMTVGLPSVVTDVGGISEVLQEGRTGFLVPKEDERLLARRLLTLANDPELRRRMGEDARRVALERFGMDRCVDEYEAFYRSLIEGTTEPTRHNA